MESLAICIFLSMKLINFALRKQKYFFPPSLKTVWGASKVSSFFFNINGFLLAFRLNYQYCQKEMRIITFLVTQKGAPVLLWICARCLSLLLIVWEAQMSKGTNSQDFNLHNACLLVYLSLHDLGCYDYRS